MAIESKLLGLLRSGNVRSSDVPAELNENRDLFVALGQAPYTEEARAGGIWNCMSAAGTPLVAFPSTLCILEIYNQLNSGMIMEVLDLTCFHLLGTAALHNISIWAQVSPQRGAAAIPALSANGNIGSQSGRAPYTATAGSRIITAAGTTVVANGWRPWGQPGSGVVSTALPGEGFSVSVEGKLIVPPGCSLCITAVDALATAASVQVGASWNEKPINQLTAAA